MVHLPAEWKTKEIALQGLLEAFGAWPDEFDEHDLYWPPKAWFRYPWRTPHKLVVAAEEWGGVIRDWLPEHDPTSQPDWSAVRRLLLDAPFNLTLTEIRELSSPEVVDYLASRKAVGHSCQESAASPVPDRSSAPDSVAVDIGTRPDSVGPAGARPKASRTPIGHPKHDRCPVLGGRTRKTPWQASQRISLADPVRCYGQIADSYNESVLA